MPNINFNVKSSEGNIINSGEGRYRKKGDNLWKAFNIPNIEDASTPNISIKGEYNLQVRVLYGNLYSPWSTYLNGFKINK